MACEMAKFRSEGHAERASCPLKTINQSPHKPTQSGDQQDQADTAIFEIGQDSPVTFDDYAFF